jgi:hypothetical protein
MDNFKIGIFDLFSSFIPGIPISILFGFILGEKSFDMYYLFEYLKLLNLNQFLFLFVICYCIGFSIQYVSYEVFKYFAEKKIWKKRIGGFPISIGKRGDEITLIRHYSPENFKVLNTFLAFRTMCYNMFFSLLVFFIGILTISIIKWEINSKTLWVLIFSFIFSFLFFRRAISFHEWLQKIITECKVITSREVGLIKSELAPH